MSQNPKHERLRRAVSTGSVEHANTEGAVKYLPNVHGLLECLQRDLGSAVEEANRVEKGIPNLRNTIAEQKNTFDEMSKQLKKKTADINKLKEELEETRTRLSKLMAIRMTDNNPNIADLSDQNRPTKLAERYGELYDNEWTDAFEMLTETGQEEITAINILRDILTETYMYCKKECESKVARFEEAFTMMPKDYREKTNVGLPETVSKEFKDYRKIHADKVVELAFQTYNCVLKEDGGDLAKQALSLKDFLTSCFRLCWMMSIQDPPIYLDHDTTTGDPFIKDKYKAYTVNGSKIEYIVWPCIYIEKGGAVLNKGVAQCYLERTEERRPASTAPQLNTQDSQKDTGIERPETTEGSLENMGRSKNGKQSQSPVVGFNGNESWALVEKPTEEALNNQTSEHTMETDTDGIDSRQTFSQSSRKDIETERTSSPGGLPENMRSRNDEQPEGSNACFNCNESPENKPEETVDYPFTMTSVRMPDDPEFRKDMNDFCSGMREFGRDDTYCMLGEEKFQKCINYCKANNINYA